MTKQNPSDVEVLADDLILDEYFQVSRLELRQRLLAGGWSESMTRYILHRPDAVCGMVYNTDSNCTYLVRQFRIGAYQKENGWTIELPAGLVDGEEDKEEALRRELIEEIGFRPARCELVDSFFASPGILTERIFSYYVEVADADRVADGGGVDDENEDIEIIEVPVDQLEQFLQDNPVRDAKTVAGLLRLIMILKAKGIIS